MKKAQLETAQKFLDAHTDKVLTRDEKLSPNCSKYNKLIDDLAFVYDHPTPLLIATRHRESTCGYYLPNNTR